MFGWYIMELIAYCFLLYLFLKSKFVQYVQQKKSMITRTNSHRELLHTKFHISISIKICTINMCITYSSPFFSANFLLYVADVAGGERTEELPLQSIVAHRRSSSLPAMDVAG